MFGLLCSEFLFCPAVLFRPFLPIAFFFWSFLFIFSLFLFFTANSLVAGLHNVVFWPACSLRLALHDQITLIVVFAIFICVS